MLLKIEQDGRRFEHREVIPVLVDESGNPSVRIKLDVPGFFLNVFAQINFVNAGITQLHPPMIPYFRS